MPKIGILSDTHGSLPGTIDDFFSSCKEIWHAGDIGNPEVIDTLEKIAPIRAVYGNIDGHELRAYTPGVQHFTYENLNIAMTHIGGYPGH
ncbi:MAG: metallophosphoesterase family protein, partial [Bacteroidota bacterium]